MTRSGGRTATPGSGVAKTTAPVPAAARTMAVFEVFAREQRELTKSEMARLLDLPESSSSDLLNTLYELGYLSRTASTRRFYPNSRLSTVAGRIAENDPVAAVGQEATALIAERSGETAACGVLADGRSKIVAVAHGTHRLRYILNVGDVYTLHATSLGKALLGSSGDEDVARLLRLHPLRKLTDRTVVDPRALEREVREHRRLGYYTASDEGTIGVSSLAVSGLVGDQAVGLTLIGPTERIRANEAALRDLVLEVRETVFGPDKQPTPDL
ncbi:MAG: IclR family transcriptional regulator [Frankia sp.]